MLLVVRGFVCSLCLVCCSWFKRVLLLVVRCSLFVVCCSLFVDVCLHFVVVLCVVCHVWFLVRC